MELINPTPLLLETLPLQIRREGFILLILLKGTFLVRDDGRLKLDPEPLPVFYGDEYIDPDSAGSVRFESDLAPFKPRADVLLVGHAYAPLGRPTAKLEVGLRVGARQRHIVVFGDRWWHTQGGHPLISAPQPFITMPLFYERAFGGQDAASGETFMPNPVGRGFLSQRPDPEQRVPLPNLEWPGQLIQHWEDHPAPAGFGVYGKNWQPRAGHLGSYDEQWQRERAPGPPRDFRSDYFNCAHPDLQIAGYLHGDEPVELVNLTPESRLAFRLPGLRPTIRVTRSERDEQGHSQPDTTRTDTLTLNLDTLCLLPEQRRFYLVWRGHCPINDLTAREIDRIELAVHRG